MKQITHSVAIRPSTLTNQSAGAVNGDAIDTMGYSDLCLYGQVGSASGTPDSFTAIFKLQDSADGSTNWADVTGMVLSTITTAKGKAKLNVPGLWKNRRYVRVVSTVAFVGGTSPAIPCEGGVLLGLAASEPVT